MTTPHQPDGGPASFILNHLSAEQMQEIAKDEFREMCRDYFARNQSASIGNIAYPIVREMVAEILGVDADQQIRDKAIEVINGLSEYTVFHAPNVYNSRPSPAYQLLMNTIEKNRDLVEKAIQHHLHNLSKHDALEIIKGAKLTIQTGGVS